jgi:anti-sigma factor RsiW
VSQLAFSRNDIHIYLDGEMPPEERLRFEAWLEDNPEAAAEVRAFRQLGERLHGAFDGVLDEPLPERHRAALAGRGGEPASRRWRQIAAAIALVCLGGLGGWLLRGLGGPGGGGDRFLAAALDAHSVYVPEVAHPVEVAASDGEHLQKWLSKRLGNPVRAPQLASEGYRLVGGRLLPGERRPAAQLMYEDGHGKRLTLYLTPAEAEANTSFNYYSRDRLSAYAWTDRPFHYAMIGEMSREDMQKICKAVYDALES